MIVIQLSLLDAGIRIEGSPARLSATRLRRKPKNCLGDVSAFVFWKLGTGNGVDIGMFIIASSC